MSSAFSKNASLRLFRAPCQLTVPFTVIASYQVTRCPRAAASFFSSVRKPSMSAPSAASPPSVSAFTNQPSKPYAAATATSRSASGQCPSASFRTRSRVHRS
nr:hypothetical protein [Streptomyces sp. MH191]